MHEQSNTTEHNPSLDLIDKQNFRFSQRAHFGVTSAINYKRQGSTGKRYLYYLFSKEHL